MAATPPDHPEQRSSADSRSADSSFEHHSVLLEDTIQLLAPRSGGRYLDGTLGAGGHARLVLERSAPDGVLVGIDRDPHALAAASAALIDFGGRFVPLRGAFADMDRLAAQHGPFDGILLDLGVSSPQLDHAHRGFSFRQDGPVDMRMDVDQERSAATLLDELDEDGLVDILRRYGEEPRAVRIARAILAGRPWTSTRALAECVAVSSGYRNSRTHPATRTFQALRIATNDELRQLERGLDAADAILAPGGRLAVITFHSLEDRLVKHRFRALAGVGTPVDAYGQPLSAPAWQLITRKGIAGRKADPTNPRSRSARLRVIQRI